MAQPLDQDMDHYYATYDSFKRNTNGQTRIQEWIEREFDSKVVGKLFGSLTGTGGADEPLRVLGIGSAAGRLLSHLCMIIEGEFKHHVDPTTSTTLAYIFCHYQCYHDYYI